MHADWIIVTESMGRPVASFTTEEDACRYKDGLNMEKTYSRYEVVHKSKMKKSLLDHT